MDDIDKSDGQNDLSHKIRPDNEFRAGVGAKLVISNSGGKVSMHGFWMGRLQLWKRFKAHVLAWLISLMA